MPVQRCTKGRKNGYSKKLTRRYKNKDWERASANINYQLGFRKASKAWKILKGMRTDTHYKTKRKIIKISAWGQLLRNSSVRTGMNLKIQMCLNSKILDFITSAKIKKALNEGKNVIPPELGGVNLDLLKYGGKSIVWYINSIVLQDLGRRSNISRVKGSIFNINFQERQQKTLHKLKRKICYKDSCPVIKLLRRILIHTLKDEYQGIEEQISNFSAGRSCSDHTCSHITEINNKIILFKINNRTLSRKQDS